MPIYPNVFNFLLDDQCTKLNILFFVYAEMASVRAMCIFCMNVCHPTSSFFNKVVNLHPTLTKVWIFGSVACGTNPLFIFDLKTQKNTCSYILPK